jgi:hypothetical protein
MDRKIERKENSKGLIWNMKYEPEIVGMLNFDKDETLAYQLLCLWVRKREQLIPDYRHDRIPKNIKNIRKWMIFRDMLKFVKDNREEFKLPSNYLEFMIAQLEIAKANILSGKKMLIKSSLLHGEGAKRRFWVYKQGVLKAKKITKVEYAVVQQSLIYDFEKTKEEIEKICSGIITLENYINAADKIYRSSALKKICDIYLYLSPWFQKLPDNFKNDLIKSLGLNKFDDFDMSASRKLFEKYFGYEL